jgi:hypothetical protein
MLDIPMLRLRKRQVRDLAMVKFEIRTVCGLG